MDIYSDEKMNKVNIGAGIVSYNPDIELLIKNIEAIISQVNEVVIFDNGSFNYEKIEEVCKKYGIIVIKSDLNIGIAAALNNLCSYFEQKEGKWWLLTLDQDTICPDNLIVKLQEHCDSKVGIISPDFINRGAEKDKKEQFFGVKKVEWTITSASLTNIDAWNKIGGFDESLFIDGVDTDFGIRLNNAGFLVLMDSTISISHKLGNSELKKLFGKIYCIQNHNAFRKYYIARNAIIVSFKNCGLKRVLKAYLSSVKSLIRVLIFEDKKKEKIVAIIKGVNDGTKFIIKKLGGKILSCILQHGYYLYY